MGFKVTVTGGITKETLAFFQPLDVSIVICGRGIRETPDPRKAAREFRGEMERLWGSNQAIKASESQLEVASAALVPASARPPRNCSQRPTR